MAKINKISNEFTEYNSLDVRKHKSNCSGLYFHTEEQRKERDYAFDC